MGCAVRSEDWGRRCWFAGVALVVALASGCGDSSGTTVVVRSLPDTSDVEAAPPTGLRICELGTSEAATPNPQTARGVRAGRRTHRAALQRSRPDDGDRMTRSCCSACGCWPWGFSQGHGLAAKLDIGLVIDESGSIDDADWRRRRACRLSRARGPRHDRRRLPREPAVGRVEQVRRERRGRRAARSHTVRLRVASTKALRRAARAQRVTVPVRVLRR